MIIHTFHPRSSLHFTSLQFTSLHSRIFHFPALFDVSSPILCYTPLYSHCHIAPPATWRVTQCSLTWYSPLDIILLTLHHRMYQYSLMITETCSSVQCDYSGVKVFSALAGFLLKMTTSVHGYGQDKYWAIVFTGQNINTLLHV
jgi:hypothetical protein